MKNKFFFKKIIKISLLFPLFFFTVSVVFALDNPRYESARTVGGTGTEWGVSIGTDSLGNMYILGQFDSLSIDFDPGLGSDIRSTSGGQDVFLSKYNSDGSYAWTRTWGGTGPDNAYNIGFDSLNNVYVAMEFSNTIDFDFSPGVDNHVSSGSVDAALVRVNADGTYGGVRVVGGVGTDRMHAVKTDSTGNLYVAGKYRNTVDFDPTVSVDNHISTGDYDVFLSKYNPDGSYAWTRTWGGTDRDTINDIVLDSSGAIYLAGVYRGTIDFDLSGSVDSHSSNGLDDVFLTRYNPDGSYAWTRTWGGTGNDISTDIGVSPSGDIYIIALFTNTVDFDPSPSLNNFTSNGGEDISVSKFKSDGTYEFTYAWGGLLIDEPYSISFDSDGKWYVSGEFGGPADLDPTLGNNTVSSNGSFDQFISVFDSNDNYLLTKKFGTATDVNWFEEIPYEAYVDNDTLYVTGNIINTSDLNPEIGTDNYVSHGGFDVYFATYSLATPGITIAPTTGLVTTESGGFATTSVVLNAKPTDNVVLNLSVSNPTEGLLASSSIVFTTTNWNIPQIVTVTGKDDISLDGDTLFTLVTDGTTSTDIGYVIPGINIPDVVVTNIDNDTLPLFVSGDGGMYRLGGCIDPLAINFERYATYQSGVCMYNSSSTTTPPLIEDVKTTPFGVCSKYITIKDRVVFGKRNDVEIVKKIQSYLNNYEGETLVVDGEYKEVDVVAVRKFQEKYGDQILAPWGFKSSTGIVAVTTVAKINSVVCAQAVTCPYFSVLTKDGESNSDVPRIKSFLNIVMNTNLDTESFLFDRETIKAVKSFQVKYTKFILQPWGLKQPTGWWYQTTIQQANKFMGCPVSELTLPNGSVIK